MKKKKILVVSPGMIFPLKMGSQVRIFNIIKALSLYHNVDVIFRVSSLKPLPSEIQKQLHSLCNKYFLILAPNKKNYLLRSFHFCKFKLVKFFFNISDHEYYFSINSYLNQIASICDSNSYDIVIFEYWYSCIAIPKLKYRPYFAVDTHDVLSEKLELEFQLLGNIKKLLPYLNRYKWSESKYLALNDLIISISNSDNRFYLEKYPEKQHLTVPIGQDWTSFINYKDASEKKYSILFYGSLSSRQNIQAFFRLFNQILPIIRNEIPEVTLMILGANPVDEIKKLNDNKSIFVSGYVKDIKEYISNCKIMILPMDLGGGFRTRALEVMALGVPVIGTHNALDSLDMTNGVHGFISDYNEEIALFAIKILKNEDLRNQIGNQGKRFVLNNYGIESCYNELSVLLSENT